MGRNSSDEEVRRKRSKRSRSRSRDRHRRRRRSRSPRRHRSRSRERRYSRSPKRSRRSRSREPSYRNSPEVVEMPLSATERQRKIVIPAAPVKQTITVASLTSEDASKRAQEIARIESDGFETESFTSSVYKPNFSNLNADQAHDAAMFGAIVDAKFSDSNDDNATKTKANAQRLTGKDLLGPQFFVPMGEKMEAWIKRLTAYRKSQLDSAVF